MGLLAVICTIVDLLDDVEVLRTAVTSGVERGFVGVFLSLPGLCGFHPSQVPICAMGMETDQDSGMNPPNLCLQSRG